LTIFVWDVALEKEKVEMLFLCCGCLVEESQKKNQWFGGGGATDEARRNWLKRGYFLMEFEKIFCHQSMKTNLSLT
jgi:hypothetical protein